MIARSRLHRTIARLAAAAVAVVFVLAQSATSWHFALVTHRVCAEHGELVHGDVAHGEVDAPSHGFELAPNDPEDEEHDHDCGAMTAATWHPETDAAVSGTTIPWWQSASDAPLAVFSSDTRYAFAPKTSPPTGS